MKIKNISTSRIYLHDLKVVPESQTEGRRGEDRYIHPGQSVYLPNTTEVLRSAYKGDIQSLLKNNKIELEDKRLIPGGGTVVIDHGLGVPPVVYILKRVLSSWYDAVGTYDLSHNSEFNTITLKNTTSSPIEYYIRLV